MTERLPDFEALAIFARIVEHGSFSEAARVLGLSRPTVSKAVSRLEQATGTALFNRTSRRLSLTETGERVLSHAVKLLGEGEAAEAELRRAAHHPHGVLRVTAPIGFGLSHIAPLLPAFLSRFDVAIRIAAHAPSSLRALHLCSIPLLLVASPTYLARRGHPTHPRDLKHHDGFMYETLSGSGPWKMTRKGKSLQVEPPRSRYRANNAEAFLPALHAGLGIGLFPEFMVAQALGKGLLERVLPDWSFPDTALCLLTPPGRSHPARVSAFLDHIGGALRNTPWRRLNMH